MMTDNDDGELCSDSRARTKMTLEKLAATIAMVTREINE